MVGREAAINGQQVEDPMDKRAYQQIHDAAPFAASMGSGMTDFVARWYLDPGVILGKGVSGYRAAVGVRRSR
jgi:hypothetical protein